MARRRRGARGAVRGPGRHADSHRHRRRRPHDDHHPAGRPVSRILVVDDDDQLRRALRINLAARGYQVLTAADATTALALAGRTPPDLAIVDLGLPDLDGVEVVRG